MKRTVLLILLLCATAARSQSSNELVSEAGLFNGEPYIAVNPAKRDNIVVAWMSMVGGRVAIVVRATSDGGAHWGATTELPHMKAKWGSADVSMAWHRSGTLYLNYIDYALTQDAGGNFIVKSNDGGFTWSAPTASIGEPLNADVSIDRPWLVADNSTTATDGNLYLVTKPAPSNPLPNHTYFTRSTNGGLTWDGESVLDIPPFSAASVLAPMGSPTIGKDGTIYIAYPCIDFSQAVHAGYALAKSTDAGVSFTRSFILRPTAIADTLAKNAFKLLADPSNVKYLVLVWPDHRNGDADIYSAFSNDGGDTWSNPIRINDDPVGNGKLQDMLWPSFNAQGMLAVVWRDRRNGTDTGYRTASDTYYAFSKDGGATYSRNYRLTDSTAPYLAILDNPGNDFMSMQLEGDTLYAAWADTRTGRVQIYFAKAALTNESWVAVKELTGGLELSVLENPVRGRSRVEYRVEESARYALSLYDAGGAKVLQVSDREETSGLHETDLDLSLLPSGSYTLRLEGAGSSIQRRIIALTPSH